MPYLSVNGKEIELDEDGFIIEPEDWTEEVARTFAANEGISELTEEHWKVIYFLHEYYEENQIAPMIRKLCKETGFSLKRVYELFPTGPAKGACKIAGLPKPTGCV